ncbi:hypothetical protein STEG23_010793 [Scotinomys teguina]
MTVVLTAVDCANGFFQDIGKARLGDVNECSMQKGELTWCTIDNRVTRVAWLNRSTILYAGNDKWCLDPRVVLLSNTQTQYSIEIQNVDVYDEGPYTCSVQTDNHPKTSRVHLIVQGTVFSNTADDVDTEHGPELSSQRALLDSATSCYWYGLWEAVGIKFYYEIEVLPKAVENEEFPNGALDGGIAFSIDMLDLKSS